MKTKPRGPQAAHLRQRKFQLLHRFPIPPDALPGTRRDAGVGALLARRRGLRAQRRVGEEWLGEPVAAELAVRLPQPPALLGGDVALDHHLALAGGRAQDQQVDTSPHRRGVGARERDLLPDDGCQVAVEREHELLELRALGVVDAEHAGAVEAEERVDAAVVQEAESAHLGAEARRIAVAEEGHLRHAEHADLLIGVAQVGDLELLRLAFDRHEAVRTEEAGTGLSTWQPLQFSMMSVFRPK